MSAYLVQSPACKAGVYADPSNGFAPRILVNGDLAGALWLLRQSPSGNRTEMERRRYFMSPTARRKMKAIRSLSATRRRAIRREM